VAAAKVVGMGNPAEKNDRAPDNSIVGDHRPSFARIFFRKIGVTGATRRQFFDKCRLPTNGLKAAQDTTP
jgi:hypothetical protein